MSDNTHVQCLIGNNVELQGGLNFSGGLHVDGKIFGDVAVSESQSGHLTLSEAGVIEGNVQVNSAEINGTILGDVHVSGDLRLHPNSKVTGNVYYEGIEISKGAKINGKMIANANIKESGKSGFFKKIVSNNDETLNAKHSTA